MELSPTAREITGTVVSTNRMTSSVNGNPRFMVTLQTADGNVSVPTMPDAMIGYAITNSEYREREHAFRLESHRNRACIAGEVR